MRAIIIKPLHYEGEERIPERIISLQNLSESYKAKLFEHLYRIAKHYADTAAPLPEVR